MDQQLKRAKEIFIDVVRNVQPRGRSAYLDGVCSQDRELRQFVEQLLTAHDASTSFLEQPAIGLDGVLSAVLDDDQLAEGPGNQIGPYKLLERIGEGGMGVVYMAAQQHPIERTVALKIIKPGMDTRACIARFEAERQALALMNHPNIAQVLDAGTVGPDRRPGPDALVNVDNADLGVRNERSVASGPLPVAKMRPPTDHGQRTTDTDQFEICNLHSELRTPHSTGRPYFVMELVRGLPITDFCDEHRLGIRERLALFVSVCRAVQHAHQKGVIHRDLKPTNVLVELHDVVPVPKIIDFGVAKAIGRPLTERTLHTGFHQMVGTPMYMSPEQAELSGLDVDTRSDVYSLGVLLYELLTGATPFDRETLEKVGYDEMRRMIREDDPPRPSGRVSTLAAASLSTIAARRALDPRKLTTALHGDLDWIVMKCLEKDRTRRYETAADLARDIERHLADEPVTARPPSRAYRANKFVRKHRTGVGAAAAIVLAIAVGAVFASIGFARAIEERRVAERERDIANAERTRAKEQLFLACEIVDNVFRPTVHELRYLPGLKEVRINLLEESVRFYEVVAETAGGNPDVRHGLARALTTLAELKKWTGDGGDVELARAIDILEGLDHDYPGAARYQAPLATAYHHLASSYALDLRWRKARQTAENALAVYKSIRVEDRRTPGKPGWTAAQHLTPAIYAFYSGQWDGILEHTRQAIQLADGPSGVDKFYEMTGHYRLAEMLMAMGRFDEAWSEIVEARRIVKAMAARNESKPAELQSRTSLGMITDMAACLRMQSGELAAAEEGFNEAIAAAPVDHTGASEYISWTVATGWHHFHRGELYALTGKMNEAEADFQSALEWWQTRQGAPLTDYNTGLAHWHLSEILYQKGDAAKADAHLAEARQLFEAIADREPDEPFCNERLIVFLSNCHNKSFRDPERAVELAQRVQSPSNGLMWRYSGLAKYRAGDWIGAHEAIRTSMKLRNGGDAIDWLLLAACQHQQGHRYDALQSFARAQQAIEEKERIFYGHIGVLGFERIRAEVQSIFRGDLGKASKLWSEKTA